MHNVSLKNSKKRANAVYMRRKLSWFKKFFDLKTRNLFWNNSKLFVNQPKNCSTSRKLLTELGYFLFLICPHKSKITLFYTCIEKSFSGEKQIFLGQKSTFFSKTKFFLGHKNYFIFAKKLSFFTPKKFLSVTKQFIFQAKKKIRFSSQKYCFFHFWKQFFFYTIVLTCTDILMTYEYQLLGVTIFQTDFQARIARINLSFRFKTWRITKNYFLVAIPIDSVQFFVVQVVLASKLECIASGINYWWCVQFCYHVMLRHIPFFSYCNSWKKNFFFNVI